MSQKFVDQIQKFDAEANVVQRSAAIAVENVKQHVGNLRRKYEDSRVWATDIEQHQALVLSHWKTILNKLSSISAIEALVPCLRGGHAASQGIDSGKGSFSEITLQEFVDVSEVEKAGEVGNAFAARFADRIADLAIAFEDVVHDSDEIAQTFSQVLTLSKVDVSAEAGRLMEEIEVVAKKVSSDYESVLRLPDSQKSISQASKTALLHTRNFLPSLLETSIEVEQVLRQSIKRKNDTVVSAVQYMQEIAAIESTVAVVNSHLANLELEDEGGQALDILNFVVSLPSLYGSLLVECVRRQEWSEKITADSSSLAEEMANFKDEEERRRKKWLKDMGAFVNLDLFDGMALGIEISVQGQKQSWPNINKQDVTRYVRNLVDLGGFEDIVTEIEDLVRALDAPSKLQARRAKAFKNGSFHEAAFGGNSFLLGGTDDILRVKGEKSKLEDKLKSSESRIRKLEDLLYRQSQMTRNSNGNVFGSTNGSGFERQATVPVTFQATPSPKPVENSSRRSSFSSRRFSSNIETEEKVLVQRIVKLEADLGVEKAQSADLQRDVEASAKAEDNLKNQVQESESTKRDLMGNLEAQQREFDDERRLLEDENSKLKVKLEEVEDELDRVLENRDQEDKVRTLEEELEKVRRDAAGEVQKAQGQTDFLQNDYIMQRDKANRLERQVQRQSEEISEVSEKAKDLTRQAQSRDEVQAEHHRALRAAHLQLSVEESTPEDFNSLVEVVELVAEKSASRLVEVKEALDASRACNSVLEARMRDVGIEIHDLHEKLGTEEMEVFSVREELAEKRAQLFSLQSELNDERRQHSELRLRFAEEEASSESFKIKIMENENRLDDTLKKLDTSESKIQSLEDQLAVHKELFEEFKNFQDALTARLRDRSRRTEDISMRLYSQKSSLTRLLEQIGFTITNQDDTMILHKTPKTPNASIMLNDASMSMNRSLSGPLPAKPTFEASADTDVLRWTRTDDLGEEARRFDNYIRDIASFNMDVFSEAIIKRIKETEHTARKWQREARAYRDKSHRAQNEAHEKIAFRTFKEGDLALFLPTRNQATRPWAAFNVGAPHYFLREQDSHKLRSRDWLLARISKVDERLVDLSNSINGVQSASDRRSIGEASDGGASIDDENPFELSDGLRWYLLDAAEEKPGAPSTPGLGKVTVASANVDAKGSIRMKKSSDGNGATRNLARSLDSRRNSMNSRKSLVGTLPPSTGLEGTPETTDPPPAQEDMQKPPRSDDPPDPPTSRQDRTNEQVRTDLLWGP